MSHTVCTVSTDLSLPHANKNMYHIFITYQSGKAYEQEIIVFRLIAVKQTAKQANVFAEKLSL